MTETVSFRDARLMLQISAGSLREAVAARKIPVDKGDIPANMDNFTHWTFKRSDLEAFKRANGNG
jgi:hypothetical protein